MRPAHMSYAPLCCKAPQVLQRSSAALPAYLLLELVRIGLHQDRFRLAEERHPVSISGRNDCMHVKGGKPTKPGVTHGQGGY